VTTGAGRASFEGPFVARRWRLADSRTYDVGVVLLEYEREGLASGD